MSAPNGLATPPGAPSNSPTFPLFMTASATATRTAAHAPPSRAAASHRKRHAGLAKAGAPRHARAAVHAVFRRAVDWLGLQLGSRLSHRVSGPVAVARLRAREQGAGRGDQTLAP